MGLASVVMSPPTASARLLMRAPIVAKSGSKPRFLLLQAQSSAIVQKRSFAMYLYLRTFFIFFLQTWIIGQAIGVGGPFHCRAAYEALGEVCEYPQVFL